MKKLFLILATLLLLGALLVTAGSTKMPIYNPFGRHLQYISTGFDSNLVKDVTWLADGTASTTLNVSINTSETLIQPVDNQYQSGTSDWICPTPETAECYKRVN